MVDTRIRPDMAHDSIELRTTEALIGKNLGSKLKLVRRDRNMTLRDVSDAAACSESLLSKIENGKALPSLPMLHRLVRCLDTSIGTIFDSPPVAEATISRAAHRPITDLDGTGSAMGIRIEEIIGPRPDRAFECFICAIDPLGTTLKHDAHSGDETGYVLQGDVEIRVDGEAHRLSVGDAFAFKSNSSHGVKNVGAAEARVLWVVVKDPSPASLIRASAERHPGAPGRWT
jgi:quercetin dioxygenase-like cupin family protein